MTSVKELAEWLKDEVEFLKENQDFVGGWFDLGAGLAAVVLWEEGWGEEIRDDAIQAEKNPDWALCAGIMLMNKDDTPDGWFMPWDSKTGDIICETSGITPNEDYDKLAEWLLDDFNLVKDFEIKPDGEVIGFEEKVEDGGLDTKILSINDKPVEEESLKESKEYSSSPYKDVIAEYFEYDSDFEFLDVVASILGRVDNFEDDEDIWQCIDDELIYTYDQWKVLEHYCTPQDANWEVALDSLSSDIFGICAKLAEGQEPEEEIEVEDEVEIEDED